MKIIVSLFFITVIFLSSALPAHAIVFLPALILIPIAKLVAVVIGGFSVPALGIGTLWSKLFGKSLPQTLGIVVLILIVLGLILATFLKLHNPNRSLF